MTTKRPYKVTYAYDAGGVSPSGEIRTKPLVGTNSSHELCAVRKTAREVSRRGGSATVWRHEHTDDTRSAKVALRSYQPYEAAIEGAVQAALDDLMYGAR